MLGEVPIKANTKFTAKELEDSVRAHCDESVRDFGGVPVVICSATENFQVKILLDTVIEVHDVRVE